MLKPTKTLRKVARVGARRRPSGAMAVALVALFVALSGGAYAAVALPNASVGAAQLKTFAVTNPKLGVNSVGSRKIMPGAVGFYRVNRNEVQLRVTGSCTSGQAMNSVNVSGGVTCTGTSPNEADSGAGTAKTLTTTNASVASFQLAGGSAYMVQANPRVTVTPAAGDTSATPVTVSCTLASGTSTSATTTQSTTLYPTATPSQTVDATLPVTVVAPSSANASTTTLSCSYSTTDTTAPTVTAQPTTVYALAVNQPTTTTTTPAAAVKH
jgi:hypothetical protein